MKKSVLVVFLLLSLLGCKHKTANEQPQEKMMALSTTINPVTEVSLSGNFGQIVKGMVLSLPKDYATSGKKYPLIISLHGLGEPGPGTAASMGKLYNLSVAMWINNNRFPESFTVKGKTWSFIVASPQLTTNERPGDFIKDYIAYMIKNYPVDPAKVYLLGLSNGAGGIYYYFHIGSGWPKYESLATRQIAAAIPICGNFDPYAFKVTIPWMLQDKVHCWLFNNSDDPTVGVDLARKWMAALTPDTLSQLTVFNAKGHGGWNQATCPDSAWYVPAAGEKLNIYQWLLMWRKDSTGKTVMEDFTPPKDTTTTQPVDTTHHDSIPPVTDTTTVPPIFDTIPKPTIDLQVSVLEGSVCDSAKGRYNLVIDFSKSVFTNKPNFYGYSFSYVSGPGGYTGGGVKSIINLCIRKGAWVFRAGASDELGNLVTKDIAFEVK